MICIHDEIQIMNSIQIRDEELLQVSWGISDIIVHFRVSGFTEAGVESVSYL